MGFVENFVSKKRVLAKQIHSGQLIATEKTGVLGPQKVVKSKGIPYIFMEIYPPWN